jgi:hypothetical protein
MTSPTEKYYPSLIDGDTDETHRLFNEMGDVHDPFGVANEPMFYMWAAARHIWLHAYKARLEHVRTTRQGARACVEYVLHGEREGHKLALPIAVVGEEEGDTLARVRVYHSMFPIFGKHDVRAPILPGDPVLRPADVVGAYHEALAAGDVERVLATLAPDAVVREPSGGEYTHASEEAHRKFYGAILAEGGIQLEKCLVTDDGGACALEYNVVRWGKTNVYPPRPGVAVYERSPGNPRLKAIRIYDDVSPPTG